MHGQLDIFAFINQLEEQQHDPYAFCWDNDINEIHYRLTNLAAKHRLSIRKTEWEIWKHVPHFGYRMTFLGMVARTYLLMLGMALFLNVLEWMRNKNEQSDKQNERE